MNKIHIKAWRKPKINFRIVGKNGKTLLTSMQGFERLDGMKKELKAIANLFRGEDAPAQTVDIHIYWIANNKSKKVIEETTITI